MEVTITKDALMQGIRAVASTVPTRTTWPILSSVLVEAQEGSVRFTGSDLDLETSRVVPAEVLSAGRAAVPGKKLMEIARELAPGPVHIKVEQGNAVLKSGSAIIKLTTMDAGEFPATAEIGENDGVEIPVAVVEEIGRRVGFAVSNEESRPVLNGIALSVKDGEITAVATNGHRLARLTRPVPPGVSLPPLVVPSGFFAAAGRMAEGEDTVRIFVKDLRIGVHYAGGHVVSRVIEGTYPNWEQVVPKDHANRLEVDSEVFSTGIRRVSVVSSDQTRRIILETGGDQLKIEAFTPDLGEGKDAIPAQFSGEPGRYAFNSAYLTEVAKHMDAERIEIQCGPSERAVLLRPMNGDGTDDSYMTLVMPLRIVE